MKKIIENIRKIFGNKIVKKVLKYGGNIIFAAALVLVAISVYGNIQSKGRNWAVPTVGSYRWLTVLSGSMQPIFNPGDLIIDKKVDVSDLKVGDVVTYIFGERFLSTHRVVEINKDNNGKLTFKTKGDNNKAVDEQIIPESMIVGKYLFRIPLVGFVLQKLNGLPGVIGMWFLFIIVVASEIYKNVKASKQQKKEETIVQ